MQLFILHKVRGFKDASTGLVRCKNVQKRAVCWRNDERTLSKIAFARDIRFVIKSSLRNRASTLEPVRSPIEYE